VQRLSGDRLLLAQWVATARWRTPLFGRDFDSRGSRSASRSHCCAKAPLRTCRRVWTLPADGSALPLFVAGLAQQPGVDRCAWMAPAWPTRARRRTMYNAWRLRRSVAGNKPYASFIHLDLVADADAPLQRWRFGLRGGRNALLAELHAMQAAGVDHIGLQFRRNERPLAETFHEIAEYVLPLACRRRRAGPPPPRRPDSYRSFAMKMKTLAALALATLPLSFQATAEVVSLCLRRQRRDRRGQPADRRRGQARGLAGQDRQDLSAGGAGGRTCPRSATAAACTTCRSAGSLASRWAPSSPSTMNW
jgi:hypothetical protein